MQLHGTVEIIVNTYPSSGATLLDIDRAEVVIAHTGEYGMVQVDIGAGGITLHPHETVSFPAVFPPRCFRVRWEVEVPDPLDQEAWIWEGRTQEDR